MLLNFRLHPRLKEDSHPLGWLDRSYLLLSRNALFPWFILVPETKETEFHELEPIVQAELLDQINLLARFVATEYPIDKMNIGMIGNIVSQLHVHLVGRNHRDSCWPGVVWGYDGFKPYPPDEVERTVDRLIAAIPGRFRAWRAEATIRQK
ncbi:MAG: HIT family protein [Gammaproteobacteria bacterium]|nr:HIT family protein [Gammaproteobacteria bacterium]MCP5416916.1 HIT family protein [Chromatiaceae bacterium]